LSLLGDRISGVTHKDPAVITALESLRDELSGPPSVVSLLRLEHALTDSAVKERQGILEQFTGQIKTNHAKFRELIQSKGLEDTVVVPDCDGGLYVCMEIKGMSTSDLAQRSKSLEGNPFLLLTEADFGMASGGTEGGFLRISVSGEPKIKEAAFRQLLELILETKK